MLLGFADTPALKGRLDVRLAKFKAFWSGGVGLGWVAGTLLRRRRCRALGGAPVVVLFFLLPELVAARTVLSAGLSSF